MRQMRDRYDGLLEMAAITSPAHSRAGLLTTLPKPEDGIVTHDRVYKLEHTNIEKRSALLLERTEE